MKKNSSENKKNFKTKKRAWLAGDLVKIKASTWNGRANDRVGVVLREVHNNNIGLFPYAVVYDMNTKEMKQFYLYDLELISAAS